MEMREFGLIEHWEKKFTPQPDECFDKYKEIPDKPRISLKNLSGAFVVLVVGFAIALLVILIEKIVYYHKKNFGPAQIAPSPPKVSDPDINFPPSPFW